MVISTQLVGQESANLLLLDNTNILPQCLYAVLTPFTN